jgi:hypothetical protein
LTKIRVKVGSAEAEVEADPEHLKEAIDLVPELASKLPGFRAENHEPPEPRREASSDPGLRSQLPVVNLEKGDSLSDIIGKFFADAWGTERRKLSDVREALESYGLNYPKQSVAVALLRLAKTTRIRRFRGEDGEFVYTSANLVARPQATDEVVESDEIPPTQPN